jgi:hypothetical protein
MGDGSRENSGRARRKSKEHRLKGAKEVKKRKCEAFEASKGSLMTTKCGLLCREPNPTSTESRIKTMFLQ